MSETPQNPTSPVQDGTAQPDPALTESDRWLSKFTGLEVKRSSVTIGAGRKPVTSPPPQQTWQRGTPTEPTAPPLEQPRDRKLVEIDQAIKGLETAAGEVGPPLGRTGAEPAITTAKEGRAALATAAGRGAIAEQLAAAPALLEGIETARLAAVKDKADCLALAEQIKLAGNALGELNKAADEIGAPLGRTGVQGDIDKLTEAHAGLGKATTREALAEEIETAAALPGRIAELAKAIESDKQSLVDLAEQQEKIRLAMEQLEVAANDIGPPLSRTAIDEDIKLLTPRVAALNDAKTREAIANEVAAAPALLVEIERVGKLAEQDKTDGLEHGVQLNVVDSTLQIANSTAGLITGAIPYAEVEPELLRLQAARDTLANAADRGSITTQLAAVPQLLQEIEQARLDSEQAEINWQALLGRKTNLEDTQASTVRLLSWMNPSVGKTDLEQEHARIDQALVALDIVATLKEYADGLDQLELDANALQNSSNTAAAEPYADYQLSELGTWLPFFQPFSDPNPVSRVFDELTLRRGNAGSGGDLVGDLTAIGDDATGAYAIANEAYTARTSTDSRLGNCKAWIAIVPTGQAKVDLEQEQQGIEATLATLATAASVQDYADGFKQAKILADTLWQKAIDAAAPSYAESALKQFGKWVPVFNKIVVPNPAATEHAALTLSQSNAGSSGNPAGELKKVADAAFAASAAAKTAYAANATIQRYFDILAADQSSVANPEAAQLIQAETVTVTNDWNAAFNLPTVVELSAELARLKAPMDELRALTVGLNDQEDAVIASLQQADKAIKALGAGDAKNALTQTYTDLELRLANAPSLIDLKATVQELMALDKAALQLVQDAHKQQFTEQAATVEGKKKIDELIKSFGVATDDPVQQAMCRAAITACYNVPLDIPEGMSVKTLPSIYEMMTMVPKKHLKGLAKLEYETDPLINTSYYGDKAVVLNAIGDGSGGAMDHKLVSQGTDKKEERVNYFNFTALHEFGHHVDDRKKVMKDNGENAGFGKWKQETIESVVDAVYTVAFAALTTVTPQTPPQTPPKQTTGDTSTGQKPPEPTPPPPPPPTEADLKKLIRSLLETGDAKKPASASDASFGTLYHVWDTIANKDGWKKCLAIRDSEASPWDKPTEISAGRAFHEGYEGDWYSYDLGERTSLGISNYQFRSPVEWFAEQYAFYRLVPGKTKPSAIAKYLSL